MIEVTVLKLVGECGLRLPGATFLLDEGKAHDYALRGLVSLPGDPGADLDPDDDLAKKESKVVPVTKEEKFKPVTKRLRRAPRKTTAKKPKK